MAKKILIGIGIIIFVFICGALAYRFIKTQRVTESYTINQHQEGFKRVLVATQQTEFKDAVMQNISNYYTGKAVVIDVIDVTMLDAVKDEDWQGIILFTTIEGSQPPQIVTDFLNRQVDLPTIFMMLTADSGKWNSNSSNIDVITSASRTNNITPVSTTIIEQIDKLIN